MDGKQEQRNQSELFIVRVWHDASGESSEAHELHGRIQHVLTGSGVNFQDWNALIAFITAALPAVASDLSTHDSRMVQSGPI